MTTTWQWIKCLLTFVLLHLTAPFYYPNDPLLTIIALYLLSFEL